VPNTFIPGSLLWQDPRPSFDYYYLDVAKTVATRGDCRRSQVGAVLVTTGHVAFFGYNGTQLPGQPGCLSGACPRGLLSYGEHPAGGSYENCIGVHAEHNAIRAVAKAVDALDMAIITEELMWRLTQGSTMYVTREPCSGCVKLMADNGVSRVVWYRPEMFEPGGKPGDLHL
jgi:dCMP deaminase